MVKLKETLLEEERLFAKNMQQVESSCQEKTNQLENFEDQLQVKTFSQAKSITAETLSQS